MLTVKESKLLDAFGSCTSPQTNYHPHDVDRLGDLAFVIYKNSKRQRSIPYPTPAEYYSVLSKYGFTQNDAQHIYDIMDDFIRVVARCCP